MIVENETSEAPAHIEEAQELNDTIQRALALPDDDDDPSESVDESATEEEETVDEETEEDDDSEDEESDEEESDEDAEAKRAEDAAENAKHDEFIKQARKLGYKIPRGGERRVVRAEREKFWRKKEQFLQEKQQAEQALQQRFGAVAQKYEKYAKVEQALEADDMDGVAKALGYESWAKVNENHLKKVTSPEYREIQALKKREQEREEQMRAQQEQMQAQRQQMEQQRAEEQYRDEVETHLAQVDDFEEWSDDPDFVNAVVTFQRQHFDGDETISVEEAAQMARDGAYQMYQRLHARFGQAEKPGKTPSSGGSTVTPSSGGTAGKKRGRKTKNISQTETTEASGTDSTADLDENAWFDKQIKAMQQARAQT